MATENQQNKNSKARQPSKAEISELNGKIKALEQERELLLQDRQLKNNEIYLLKEEISRVKKIDSDRKVLLSACCKTFEAFKKIKSEASGLHTRLAALLSELQGNSIEKTPMTQRYCENEFKIKDREVLIDYLFKLIEKLIESREESKLGKVPSTDWETSEIKDVEENLKKLQMEIKELKREQVESNRRVAEFHNKTIENEQTGLNIVHEMSNLRLKCDADLSTDEAKMLASFVQSKFELHLIQ